MRQGAVELTQQQICIICQLLSVVSDQRGTPRGAGHFLVDRVLDVNVERFGHTVILRIGGESCRVMARHSHLLDPSAAALLSHLTFVTTRVSPENNEMIGYSSQKSALNVGMIQIITWDPSSLG